MIMVKMASSRFCKVSFVFVVVLCMTTLCIHGIDVSPQKITFINNRTLKCDDDWEDTCPDTDNVTHECSMHVTEDSKHDFLSAITQEHYAMIYLNLSFTGEHLEKFGYYTKCVVQPQSWVWTFPGNKGAEEFLRFPPEYPVWSLGLLTTFTRFKPLQIDIKVNGSCPIVVGRQNTTERIGLALTDVVRSSKRKMMSEKYNESIVCYRVRVIIKADFLYRLCLYVICPLEAIGYRCCKLKKDRHTHRVITKCSSDNISFDKMWWIYPFVAGVLLFCYFPIAIMWFASELLDWTHEIRNLSHDSKQERMQLQGNRILFKFSKMWMYYSPVNISMIICQPPFTILNRCPNLLSRFLRFSMVCLSMGIIVIKICVHGQYQNAFIKTAVKQGSPMEFLSILAGYKESRRNFLHDLGGPIVASALYLVGTSALLCIPENLGSFLEAYIPDNIFLSTTPLTIERKMRYKLGSVIVFSDDNGYKIIMKSLIGNFFMLLNPGFWSYALLVQFQRLFGTSLNLSHGRQILAKIIFVLLFPFYVVLCIFELALCIIYYGCPAAYLLCIVLRAYCGTVLTRVRKYNSCVVGLSLVIVGFVGCLIIYVMYMSTIVFVDSFLFLCRVAIFTYTGLFVYPKATYGYVIFAVTVSIYIFEHVVSVRHTYQNIFVQLKQFCKIYQEKHETEVNIYMEIRKQGYIPCDMFFTYVDRFKPRRVQLFLTSVNVTLIFVLLYVSVYLLTSFQTYRGMTILTHIFSTMFVCSIPKLLTRMCTNDKHKMNIEMLDQMKQIVDDYCNAVTMATSYQRLNSDDTRRLLD